MTDTVPRRTRARHYRKPSRVAVYAAADLGMKASSIDQLIRGRYKIQKRMAAIVAAAVRAGNLELVSQLLEPSEAALAGLRDIDHPVTEVIRVAQEDDMAEDVAEARYHADPTRRNRLKWISSLHRQRASTLRLLHTLTAIEEC